MYVVPVDPSSDMAEPDNSQISMDEKVAQAQELLSVATRNYYVKAYADAVDDFSTVCELFSEVYGPSAEKLGKPYLMYAKCLVAMGQEENKLMDVPEEEGEEDDDEEEPPVVAVNGASSGPGLPSTTNIDSAQPSTSTGITKSEVDSSATVDDEEEDVANMQVAWEVLELAAGIFSRHQQNKELSEAYIELAGISFENSNFEVAIKDFKRALGVLQSMPEKDNRELAEINYKIGLAYTMLNLFEEAKIALMKACCYLDEEIKGEAAKPSPDADVVQDLRDTKGEIENKIAEVDEYKQQSMDVVKQELAKLVGHHQDSFDKSAGEGTSSKAAVDISHLVKRKKPEEAAGDASSVAASDITHLVKRKKDQD